MMKIPLILEPQEEGGWTITSPLIPELVTEIDGLEDLSERVNDALAAVVELYEDIGKQFPVDLRACRGDTPVLFESLVMAEG